jgi:hypothetical protein
MIGHGYYTNAAIEERQRLNNLLKEVNELTSEICSQ